MQWLLSSEISAVDDIHASCSNQHYSAVTLTGLRYPHNFCL